jgi:adenosylhomocysteine nucleosidase
MAGRDGAVFIQTGIGVPEPGELIERARALGATGLLSVGTAGGLARNLAPGTVLLPKRLQSAREELFETAPKWHAAVHEALRKSCPVATGDLLCVDAVVRRPDQKRALHESTRAIAVDMESIRLARIARTLDVPYLVLRVVMDAAGDEVPGAALAGVTPAGDTDVAALLGRLCKHPSDLGPLIVSALRYRTAAGMLRRSLATGGNELLNPG